MRMEREDEQRPKPKGWRWITVEGVRWIWRFGRVSGCPCCNRGGELFVGVHVHMRLWNRRRHVRYSPTVAELRGMTRSEFVNAYQTSDVGLVTPAAVGAYLLARKDEWAP